MRVSGFLVVLLSVVAVSVFAAERSHRPETWFHLIGGNVSKEGLTADLEAIKDAGIGGIQLFHGQMGAAKAWPGVSEQIPCLSEKWDDMIAHVGNECARLGLAFKMQNCPGWSMSGGPWITPENAMRELVYSRTDVASAGCVRLPVPEKGSDRPADRDYRDLFVLAFPTPRGDEPEALRPVRVDATLPDVRIYDFAQPVCIRSVELPSTSALNHDRTYDPAASVTISAIGEDGSETIVTCQDLPAGNWQDNRANGMGQTLALDEAVSRRWKVSIRHQDPIGLKDVRLYSGARLNHWEGLAGWTLRGLVDRGVPKQNSACWIRAAQVVDLTERMAKDGTLSFVPPDGGPWTILRIGHINGLCRNGPAPAEATGWECSKLSKGGIEANYRGYIGRLVKGPVKGRLAGLVVDSWECYRQNWTEGLDSIFRTRIGYDLKPMLPAVFGWVMGDPRTTEGFLRDWRGLLGKLVEENYYGRLSELAHADGLTVQYETAFGDALAGDLLAFWKYADVPMCEFWRPFAKTGVGSHDFKPVKPCVSAAHVYGSRRVAAEALTNCALTWDEKLSDFKTVIDRHFARGVTHLIFHTYTHNPQVGFRRPGTSFGYFIGTPFIRGQDWWKHMRAFTDYVTRCGEFLEDGKPVVDVLRVLGDGLGHKPSERAESFGNRFKEDYVNKDVLMNRLSVRNGRLALPDGMEYAVLWIPEGTYLDAESAGRIDELERRGAKVVRSGDPTKDLLADVVSSDGKLQWYHRRVDGEDRYFVSACDAACAGDVLFRGRKVRLDLDVGESRFVTFGASGIEIVDPVTGKKAPGRPSSQSGQTLARCEGELDWSGCVLARSGERVWLDLGAVYGVAEVFVNGRSAATCWCPPWRCELTNFLRAGTNDIRVAVATTWYNRLRLDQARPESNREYWTICPPKGNAPPKQEGLHGLIRILNCGLNSVLAADACSCARVDEDARVGGLYRSQLHRGGGKARPDNTLEACLWCWGQGVAPEADARFTKDCVAIAFHDEDLKRVTRGLGNDLAERKLSDLTWPEIRDLDVGSYLGPEHSSVRISTMESIFAAMKGRPERYLYLDEKGVPPAVMAQMARQFGVERQVCYTSPDYFKVREWSRNVPNGETMVWIGGGWHPEMTDEAVGVMNESLNRKLMVMATNDFEGVSQVQLHVFVDVNRTDDWFAPSSERLADAIARLHAKGIRVQAGVWGRYSDRADVFDKVWDLGFDSFATDNSYEYLAWHRAKMTSRLQGPIDRTGSPDALPMTFDGTAGQDGGEWLDDRGVHINAHGGGVIWHEGRYYWYGEHKGSGLNGNVAHGAAVHCYSSEDLAHWKDEGVCLMTSTNAWHDLADGCIIERPKVAYCRKTGKFVMYFHLELKTEPQNYDSALVGIAVNDSPTDCFTYIGCRRPNAGVWPKGVEMSEMTYRTIAEACEVANCKDGGVNNRISVSSYPFAATFWRGQLSRDQALFVDDDGMAYHIYASEHNSTLHISELTDDFIGETGRYWRLGVKDWTEAPAICKHDGWYYILGSGCTGWKPNAARYYRSRSIAGPWERMGNPCRGTDEVTGLGADMTWGCQSTCIFPVRGRTDSVIAMFDRWRPENAMDGRYVWREVGFTDDGRMTIPWKKDDGVTEP